MESLKDSGSMVSDAIQTEATDEAQAAGGWMTFRELLLLLILAAVQFTHIVDFTIIMPLGPVFSREMDLTPRQFGAVVAAYTISAGIAGLLAARFLDRFDRKSTLLVLYGGFIVGTLLCAVAPNFLLLLAARTVAGAFGGVVASVVFAIVGGGAVDDAGTMQFGDAWLFRDGAWTQLGNAFSTVIPGTYRVLFWTPKKNPGMWSLM
jgi:MFS family permease